MTVACDLDACEKQRKDWDRLANLQMTDEVQRLAKKDETEVADNMEETSEVIDQDLS